MSVEAELVAIADERRSFLQWTPIIAGAMSAAALSLILISFGAAIGLGVSSASPTWRDASAALALLSGLYLILQALVSFGVGGYLAGRLQAPFTRPAFEEAAERRDGLHGLIAWALTVLMGAAVAALLAASAVNRQTPGAAPSNAAEPLLSYELDQLFRSPRRAPNVDLRDERAEAGRILLTSSSHTGVKPEDRTYLIQQVAATTGLSAPDAEKRVDSVIADARTAISRSRRSSIILAFSVAAALLLGAVVAWTAAVAGGRERPPL
jgi:hypothetical protein